VASPAIDAIKGNFKEQLAAVRSLGFDLLMKRADELLAIDNFGSQALTEVYKALAKLGFRIPRKRKKKKK
jgi:DNA-directed RNA polymerase alpha subunit